MKGKLLFALASLIAATMGAGLTSGAAARPVEHNDSPPLAGVGEGLKLVANIPYLGGTDMEFRTIKGRDYAFAAAATGIGGATTGALRVIDVTNPAKPKVVATLDCSMYQADVQISHDNKTAILAADRTGGPDSCIVGKKGFVTVDISNPKKPKAIGIAEIPRGSHNVTAHPTKPYVYNSDSDLTTPAAGEIEIWSIKNPAKPTKVGEVVVGAHSPHDISFNKKGTLAVTAAVSHWDILDTSDPKNPQIIFTSQCPGCTITHDAKFTPDGDTIIIGDEGGGGGEYPCPGGALYFYQVQEWDPVPVPVLTGLYEPTDLGIAPGNTLPGACTSHVFDISDNGKRLAISWYTLGTRYLDIADPTGVTLGQNSTGGIKELGWFIPEDSVSWSSKFHKGPYIYSNDEHRGFDVYRVVVGGE